MNMLFLFLSFLVLCFPVFYSPVSLIGILMLISLGFVVALSLFGSFWYSYILCLIYVGGLLVLFIYICLVSSNFPISMQMEVVLLVSAISVLCLSFNQGFLQPLKVLGFSTSECGSSLVEGSNVSIFMFLVVLLLAMLLVVVRVSGVGTAIVANEKT
uniref:NADH dehydrogenase subunit 6 n=1 Tax=Facelina bostoniensis TaxID=219665 RepID=UPI00257A985B|nr:NADH dehydrogenase subunit 6 [Facelina bostoniensis]WGV42879.1 NADH dehydrogenase subunit 6 [Facelina bostoniensis]